MKMKPLKLNRTFGLMKDSVHSKSVDYHLFVHRREEKAIINSTKVLNHINQSTKKQSILNVQMDMNIGCNVQNMSNLLDMQVKEPDEDIAFMRAYSLKKTMPRALEQFQQYQNQMNQIDFIKRMQFRNSRYGIKKTQIQKVQKEKYQPITFQKVRIHKREHRKVTLPTEVPVLFKPNMNDLEKQKSIHEIQNEEYNFVKGDVTKSRLQLNKMKAVK